MSTTLEKPEPVTQEAKNEPASERKHSGLSTRALGFSLLMGVYFGIVLTKSEVVLWQRVHDMFLFNEAHMYLIIGVGVIVAMISMLVIKGTGAKSLEGKKKVEYKPKPFQKGVVIGGFLFGAGWAITGACPGPIYAQVGSGASMALFTLAGAMFGMYVFANLKPRLPS